MLLLDSQVALWVLTGSRRLGDGARARIASSGAVHLSAASIWELTIKSMLGKLDVPADLTTLAGRQGLRILPVTGEHAEGLRQFLELARHDPVDRLMVSQAAAEQLVLITADAVLLALDRDFLVDARL